MLKGNICCQTHSQPDSQTSFERLFFNNCMWFSAAYKIQAPAIIHRITRMPVIFRNNIHFFTFLLHDFMVSFQLKRKYWHRENKCRLRHRLFFPAFSDSQTRADALYCLLTQAVCSWSAWKKQMTAFGAACFSCATPVRKLLYIADSIFLFLQSAYHGCRAR